MKFVKPYLVIYNFTDVNITGHGRGFRTKVLNALPPLLLIRIVGTDRV